MNFAALCLESAKQISLASGAGIIAWENVSGGTFVLRLFHGTLALKVKVFEKQFRIVAEVVKRS